MESKKGKVAVGSGTPSDADHHINMDELPKEQIPNLMMMFLAQNMEKAGLSDEFILLVRTPDGHNGLYTTITDEDVIRERLRKAAAMTPKRGEVDPYEVNMDSFLPVKN